MSIAVRRRKLMKRVQGRHAQLLACSKWELLLGFVPDSTEHSKSCGRIHRVLQQSGLANAGLPTSHDRAPVTGACGAKDPIEYLALASPPK
ncbi:MAG: hypothetical protein WBW80_14805 [Acidimicrobiales bacterium]